MERFQNAVLKLAGTLPNAHLAPPARALLQDRLNQFVSNYKTPDHPPYSAMIEKAIRELDEEQGSTEDSISRLLEKEYNNLPWAHKTMLKHYLENLCASGDIVLTQNRYKLPGEIPIPNPPNTKVKKSPPKKKTMWKWDWEKEKRRRLRKKKKLAKLRMQQKNKKAKVVEENGGNGNLVSRDITILPTQKKHNVGDSGDTSSKILNPREEKNPISNDITTLMAQPQLEISKPPGFENLLNPSLGEVEAMPWKDLSDSERARRQMRRWNQSPTESKDIGSAELVTFQGSKEKHSSIQKRLNLEIPPVHNSVGKKGSVPIKADEVYTRRRNQMPEKIKPLTTPVPKVDEVYVRKKKPTSEKFEPQSNEKGAEELPHIKVSQPRRSTRLATSAKVRVNDVMDYDYVIALPAQNCPKDVLSDDQVGGKATGKTPKCGGRD